MPPISAVTPEKFASFGELLRFLRRKADLTQRELAIAVGYSESQISRLEKNERAPDEATLAARFVPALYIEDEPKWVARLLELGASTHAHTSEADALQPIAEAKPTPHNLPIQLTSFIGREKEIIEIKRLLSGSDGNVRLLTLTGPGGCGKTRLALQAAFGMLEVFPDGVWLVEFAPLADPLIVPQTVSVVLGLKEEQRHPLLVTLTNHLRGKRVLLVLDNCEHLIQPIAQLAEALLQACPGVFILSTSREMLSVAGERSLSVHSLAIPDSRAAMSTKAALQSDAVRLFVERANSVAPHFALTDQNVSAVVQVCQRLDGIPLAIELAAARLKILSTEQLTARLNDTFHLLTGGSRTALHRQQTLQATMDWSYGLLSEKEQHLLRRLSVFAGGWTLEAAEAVCASEGLESTGILDGLTQLVNKSLVLIERVQGEEIRYRMLEIIRQYAMGKLTASSEVNEAQQQHARYYLAQAEAYLFGPGFLRLEQQHDNLRTALAWCLSNTGDVELGLRLATAMSSGMFPVESCRWLEAVLSRADTAGVNITLARANALFELGHVLAYRGDYAAGRAHMTHSLKLFQELGEYSRVAWTLGRLGILAREQGDATTARAQLEESIALFRELGDKHGIASSSVSLGEVAVLQEDPEWAIPLLEEGLELMKERKDVFGPNWVGWVLNHLGHIAQIQGQYTRAMRLHEESISQFREVEELYRDLGFVWGYESLGETALAEGKAAIAARHLMNALGLSQDGGFQAETAWCLAGLAGVAALNEEPERAAWLWGAAEALRQSIGARIAPAARATHERLKADVRKHLGEAMFNAKWAEGQAASLEEAIAEAMS
jgi:predicted ATPase/DNA-binding XRE family transcriptional regulator